MLASKQRVYLPELVLVPKSQPGVQVDLNSSELPDEIKKIVNEDTVKELMQNEKAANIPANYVLQMHDTNYVDFTRYEILHCSQFLFNFFTSFV